MAREQLVGATPRRSPRARMQLLAGQAVEVGDRLAPARRCWSARDLLLAEPVDVHDPARTPSAAASGARGTRGSGSCVKTEPSLTVGVSQNGQRSGGRGGGERSGFSSACGAGESTCGITSPARSTITSSPARMSLRARSSSLCSVAIFTVTPPTWTGSSARERVQVAELADVPEDLVELASPRWWAGTSRRSPSAGRGRRRRAAAAARSRRP